MLRRSTHRLLHPRPARPPHGQWPSTTASSAHGILRPRPLRLAHSSGTATPPSAPGDGATRDGSAHGAGVAEGSEDGAVVAWPRVRRQLLALVRPDLRLLSLGLGCLAVSTAVSLILPIGIGHIVDALQPGAAAASSTAALTHLRQSALALGGLFVVGGLATAGRVACVSIAGERIAARLRRRVFGNVVRQEVAFFDGSRAGELANRLSTDVQVVSDTLTRSIVGGMRSAAEGVGGILLLCYLSTKLTGIAVAVFPALGIGMMFYGRIVRGLSKRYMDSLAEATGLVAERLGNIRTVKLFTQERAESVRYDGTVQRTYELGKEVAVAKSVFHAGVMTATNMAVLLVLYFGGAAVIAGDITTGALTSFLLYSIYVGISFTSLGSVYGDIMKAVGASQRVMHLLERRPQIEDSGNHTGSGGVHAHAMGRIRGDISFSEVSFSYPERPSVRVLDRFSLDIGAGQFAAIVGGSGSGKSTLVALINRLYDVNDGCVLIDGADVREMDPLWLRRQIGVVPQNPTLFNATIAENIRYGYSPLAREGDAATKEEVPFDAVMEAARQANAHDFIMSLPEGYDTEVGERGHSISGGQAQRIAIARALIKDPRILILDEATNSLDAESEYLVQQALERVMQGRTSLVIAHRLSTIRKADRVCVIAEGRVAEVGTHEELLIREGTYSDFINRQQLVTAGDDTAR